MNREEKIDPYFLHQSNLALKTAKKLTGMGEYLWAQDWEKYAKEIRGYALEYQRALTFARRNKKPEPVMRLPLQPANLTSVTRMEDGVEVTFRRQCTPPVHHRPHMFQCASV